MLNTKRCFLFLGLLAGFSLGAQDFKGSVWVTIQDSNQQALPGVVVTLSADTFNRTATSDAQGQVRFIGLIPGRYDLMAALAGFETVKQEGLMVDTSANLRIPITLQVESSSETSQLATEVDNVVMLLQENV